MGEGRREPRRVRSEGRRRTRLPASAPVRRPRYRTPTGSGQHQRHPHHPVRKALGHPYRPHLVDGEILIAVCLIVDFVFPAAGDIAACLQV